MTTVPAGVGDQYRDLAVGMYVLWLVAVVLLLAGRFTAFPVLPGTTTGVVLGAVVFTILSSVWRLRLASDRLRG